MKRFSETIYKLYNFKSNHRKFVSDKRYQRQHIEAYLNKSNFKFNAAENDIRRRAVVLTRNSSNFFRTC